MHEHARAQQATRRAPATPALGRRDGPSGPAVVGRAVVHRAANLSIFPPRPVPVDDDHAPATQRRLVQAAVRSAARPLDPAMLTRLERFHGGADLGATRVHTGSLAQRSAAAIDASAYTVGNHIVLGRGVTPADGEIMAHETRHVVDPVPAGVDNGAGLPITDPGHGHERAAGAAGDAFRAGASVAPSVFRAASEQRTTVARIPLPADQNGPPFFVLPKIESDYETRSGRRCASWVTMVATVNSLDGWGAKHTSPPGWEYIKKIGQTMFWKRFHLINELAGGPGEEYNLVTASQADNVKYGTTVEKHLKVDFNEARKDPNKALFFGVEVTYRDHDSSAPSLDQQRSSQFFPASLKLHYRKLNAQGRWESDTRHDGQPFTFQIKQPADLTKPLPISNMNAPDLKRLVPYDHWDDEHVKFMQKKIKNKYLTGSHEADADYLMAEGFGSDKLSDGKNFEDSVGDDVFDRFCRAMGEGKILPK